jgi:TPR repeat protein
MAHKMRFATVLTSLVLVLVCASTAAQQPPSPPDDIKALTAAAELGDPQAHYDLALAYDLGSAVRRSTRNAERWYRRSADSGHADAQNAVGSIYQERRQYREAVTWYEKAAAQGHPRAISNLGYMHDLGLGVPQNHAQAFQLYSDSADRGWAEAMWNLANMYVLGQSVEPSYYQGCIWSFRAKRFALSKATVLLARVAAGIEDVQGRLSPEEFARCKSEADAWQPANKATTGAI